MGLRAPQRCCFWRGSSPRRENGIAGLGAPHPDMRDGFYGASPHAPTENHYIWGFAPNPTRGLFSPKVPETRKNRTA